MEYLSAAFMGLLQGVTEFLPVSSSGHLSLFQNFFNGQAPDALFNVLLHFATLLAVCVVYWRDIWEMIVEFFLLLHRPVFPPALPGQPPGGPADGAADYCGHSAPVPGPSHQG